jgi:hypothetical protein
MSSSGNWENLCSSREQFISDAVNGVTDASSQTTVVSIVTLDKPEFRKVDTTEMNGFPTDAPFGLWQAEKTGSDLQGKRYNNE